MVRRFSTNFALFSIALDSLLVCIALAIATYTRPSLGFLPFAARFPEIIPTPWLVYPVFAIEWTAVLLLFSVYDARRDLRRVDEFIRLSLGTLLAAGAMAGTLYLTYRMVSRLLFVVFILLGYLGMLAWRGIAGVILRHNQSRPGRQRKILIVGSGEAGQELCRQISQNPQLGLKVAGSLDDTCQPCEEDQISTTPETIQEVIERLCVEEVVIALPQEAYQRLNDLVCELHHLPVKVWVIPDYFRLALHKASIEEFAGIPMLDLRAPALNEYQRMVKRAFDLVVTILLLPIALPLMGLIALMIRSEGRGTIFFRQQRVGENGRLFGMWKFRSMIPNAEELQSTVGHADGHGNLIHKTIDDPRVTRIGRLLRRYSLDELPQFFNVLKGDMSLVGPRPELPYLVDQYQNWQRQRFAVPQGITGWWQIHGRSDKPMHLNTEDDLYYVQNYSLLLDIYILIKTVSVVVSSQGAF